MNLKRLTFSYDDGVTQDRRLVPLLNRYMYEGDVQYQFRTLK